MGGPGGGGGGYATTGSIGATAGSGGDAVDECGLRFLLAMRHHTCLMRSLPPKHRAVLEEKVSETGLLFTLISPTTRLTSAKKTLLYETYFPKTVSLFSLLDTRHPTSKIVSSNSPSLGNINLC